MKKWLPGLAVVLILLLIVGVCIGSYYVPVMTADCIVRVSYTGFAQLYHEPYAYYAVRGTDAVRVAPWVLEQIAPEVISGSKYGDVASTQWFAHLYYAPYLSYFQSEQFLERDNPWMPTDFGENYRVYYDHWHGAERMPEEQEQKVLLDAAQTLHSGDINDWSSTNGIDRGLTWYILVSNGDQMLLQLKEEQLYRPMVDGSFELVMDCPESGQFDYYWFP